MSKTYSIALLICSLALSALKIDKIVNGHANSIDFILLAIFGVLTVFLAYRLVKLSKRTTTKTK
jgi:uncharacterized membrane protein YdcZ (DUF606 family)